MKKNIKLKTWMTVAAVSICLNGILFYLFAISISISPSTISIGINLITLLGNFFLSFLVSIVYTYFCRISDEEKEKKREKEMEEKIQNIYLKMLEMAPTHVYPAANQPIEDFNQRLNRSISRTKNYFYFSDRGLYVVKRLKNDIEKYNERLSVSICLQDICDKSIFRARAEEYRKREIKQKGYRNLETIIRDEQLNILRVLYVISKLDDLDIRVYLHKEIPFIRFEITDDMLAISFLPMLMEGKKYPPTLIYENEILFRQSYMDYINDVMNRAVLLKKEELTLDFLIELGKKAGISDFTKEDIVCYYNEL
jgi:hypothetical protein